MQEYLSRPLGSKASHDVEDWTHVLSACLLDGQHLRQFKEQLLQTNPGFLQSVELYQSAEESRASLRLYNDHGKSLVDWWCNLCLVHGEIEGAVVSVASSAANRLPSVRSSTMRSLADYFAVYEQKKCGEIWRSRFVPQLPSTCGRLRVA